MGTDKDFSMDAIETQALAHGLTLGSVERRGSMLIVEPAPGSKLPSADALRLFSSGVRDEHIRYVTLRLDGERE